MADLSGFDANKVDPNSEFEPIPAGKYLAVIVESEMKQTKAGTGSYLQLTHQIVDGPFKGRKVWSRLNLDNPNPTAVQIAKGELSALCRAAGVMTPRDSAELHNIPVVINVRQKPNDATGEIQNEIRGYTKHGNGAAKQAPQEQKNVPPWLRK